MLRLKSSPSELEQLKELLLADELEKLKTLEEKVETLDFESRDNATIMKRVTPAISKGIAENKETMIDALYPIMGGMISKYVTQAIKEMMETINKKIEQGLSFERVKRKAKAKLTGVSESELLVEESGDARISSLFVIHKETSMLIAEAHLENKEIDDAHMVASMASAIKDFINDWMQHADTQNEVQLLSYGNATLYIESAGSVFIIAFLDAEPDYEQRTHINTFFASIVKEYAAFFQTFDGDDSAEEIVPLSMKMEDYLYAQNMQEMTPKKNPAKMIFIVLGVVLLGYGIYLFQGWYRLYSLEKMVYVETHEKIMIEKEGDTLVLEGNVASIEVMQNIEKLLERHHYTKIQDNLDVPLSYLESRFKTLDSIDSNASEKMREKLDLLERSFAKAVDTLNEKVLTLSSSLETTKKEMAQSLHEKEDEISKLEASKENIERIVKVKNEIYNRLDNVLRGNPYYMPEEHSLDFGKLVLFSPNETAYHVKAIQALGKTFESYMKVLVKYKPYISAIYIEGHSDNSGLESDNIALSKKRALAVKYYLERLNIVKQYHMRSVLHSEGYGSAHVIMHNGIEDKKASRRIKITFDVNEDEILNQLRGMIK